METKMVRKYHFHCPGCGTETFLHADMKVDILCPYCREHTLEAEKDAFENMIEEN